MEFEKVVIFSNKFNNDVFNNTTTSFQNILYPIQRFQEFDYIVPMVTNIPVKNLGNYSIKSDYLPLLFGYSTPTKILSVKVQYITTPNESNLIDVDIYLQLIPLIPSSFLFVEKEEDIASLFKPVISTKIPNINNKNFKVPLNLQLANTSELAFFPTVNILLHPRTTSVNVTGEDYIFSNGLLNLKLSPVLTYSNILPSNLNNAVYDSSWSAADKLLVQANYNVQSFIAPTNFIILGVKLDGYTIELPEDFYSNSSSEISDEEQLYIHCDKIELSRIANQNENIYKEIFVNSVNIDSRIADYTTLTMSIPIKLISNLLDSFEFKLNNAVDKENQFVDKNRNCFILCKFIKHYYNISDGKTEIDSTISRI